MLIIIWGNLTSCIFGKTFHLPYVDIYYLFCRAITRYFRNFYLIGNKEEQIKYH